MAIRKIEDIPEEAKFGRRLFTAAEKNDLIGPPKIAEVLYENDEYFSLIQVGKRKEKHFECRNRDIASISRRVQAHYNAKTADEVPSGYILAYSKLFRCSTDYLYGLIDIPAPDAETADICRKTGLSEKAVKNLMSGGPVFLDEFLWTADRYGLLEKRPTDTTDNHNAEEDPEDDYLDTECSMTDFWNTILENDIFNMAPQAWYRMACAMYTCKGMKAIAEDYDATKEIIPPRETFLSQVEMHNIFHPEDKVYGHNELPIEEAYENNPEWAREVYHDIIYHDFFSEDRESSSEMIYWGCAGQFDRLFQSFFHKWAEKWCTEGPLPPIK